MNQWELIRIESCNNYNYYEDVLLSGLKEMGRDLISWDFIVRVYIASPFNLTEFNLASLRLDEVLSRLWLFISMGVNTVLCPRESWITWLRNAWSNCKQVQCSYFCPTNRFCGISGIFGKHMWELVNSNSAVGEGFAGEGRLWETAGSRFSHERLSCDGLFYSPSLFFLVFSFRLWGQSTEHHVTFKGITRPKMFSRMSKLLFYAQWKWKDWGVSHKSIIRVS